MQSTGPASQINNPSGVQIELEERSSGVDDASVETLPVHSDSVYDKEKGVEGGAGAGRGEEVDELEKDVPPASDVEDGVKRDDAAPVAEFPDGGLRAWSIVGAGWCVSFTTWGFVNAYGLFQAQYSTNQLADYSPSAISWIGSVQLSMILASGIVVGRAFDRGHLRVLMLVGTAIYFVSLIGLSFATTYAQIFVAQGFGCGIASGFLFLPAVSVVSHYFSRRRATALGILATGSSFGGVVYPLLLNNLFPRVGFAWAVRAAAFMTLGLLSIACITMRTRLPPRKLGKIVDFSVFKDPAYSCFVLGNFLVVGGIYVPYFYIQTYASRNGVPSSLAFYSLSILNAASLFGRLIPAWAADRYGALTVLFPNCLISGLLIFVWIVAGKTSAGLIVFALVYGFASGAFVSMLPACIASMTVELNQIGIRMAMSFVVVSVAALVGTPISGVIVTSQNGSFVGAAIYAGVLVVAGAASMFVARLILVRRVGSQWV